MITQVKDVMKTPVVTVDRDSTISEAGALMRDARVGCLVVVEEGAIQGIITDRDIATRVVPIVANVEKAVVGDYMTKDPITVMPNVPVLEALKTMKDRKVKRLPVVFAARLEGIVALVDIAQTLEPTAGELATSLKVARHNV